LDHRTALEQGLTTKPLPKLSQSAALGRQTLENLGNAVPAFPKLQADLHKAAATGWLTTLDGRKIPIGSEHTAIAMLLQGAEACVMKKAMALAKRRIESLHGAFVLWVHDEFQVEALPEHAETIGKILVDAMGEAGESFGLRVKLDGAFKVGKTWAETH
jgi:DNA polymerase I-like protein with 3'-5' exonuclease and polymerase domains